MFRKSFVLILVVATVSFIGYAQTPEAKKDKGSVAKTFAWTIDGDSGYLGIQTQEVSKQNFAKFGLHAVRGVAVEKVLENSPAAAAGMQNGDVIVRVDGEEVTSTRKLTRLISEIAPDHQTKLTVFRNGSEQEVTATLGKRPTPAFENGNFLFNVPEPMGKFDVEKLKDLPQLKDLPDMKDLPKGEMPGVFAFPGGEGKTFTWTTGGRQIGVGVTPLTKQLADHFGVDGGLLISEVRNGSPAFKAGLKAGDIIVEADGKAIKGDFDLIRTINQKKEGDVTLTIVRDGNHQTISVTPEASKDAGFVFNSDGETGLTQSPAPGRFRVMTPAMSATPMAAPAAITLVRPGRIL